MNFVTRFAMKRIGSYLGGRTFGSGITSCDGINSSGESCCFNSKEAKEKNMPYCSVKPMQSDNKLGGINVSTKIFLEGNYDGPIYFERDGDDYVTITNGEDPISNDICSFEKDIFLTCVMLTINGKNMPLSVSLDSHMENDIEYYKLRLSPQVVVQSRMVGELLFASDWLLKCLHIGEFIDFETGTKIEIENQKEIMEKLQSLGYESCVGLKNKYISKQLENDPNFKYDQPRGRIWIEPSSINVKILDNIIKPNITISVFTKYDSDDIPLNPWDQQFTEWMNKNFNNLANIFPVFAKLQELIMCLTIIKVLRFHDNINLNVFEPEAYIHLHMDYFVGTTLAPKLCKIKQFNSIRKGYAFRGGIVLSNDVQQINPSEPDNIYLNISLPKGIQINNTCEQLNILLSNRTLFKLKCGFMIKIKKGDCISIIKQKLASMLMFPDSEWIELYYEDKPLENSSLINLEVGKTYNLGMSFKIKFKPEVLSSFHKNNIKQLMI